MKLTDAEPKPKRKIIENVTFMKVRIQHEEAGERIVMFPFSKEFEWPNDELFNGKKPPRKWRITLEEIL